MYTWCFSELPYTDSGYACEASGTLQHNDFLDQGRDIRDPLEEYFLRFMIILDLAL